MADLSSYINITANTVTSNTALSTTGNITANNIGNVAALNLNDDANTVLYGNGVFASVAGGSSYGNSNVATFLGDFGSNVVSTTGNISAGNVIATNIGNIASINLNGNANTVLYGNGTFALPLPSSSYGNANVTALLSAFGSNTISTSGNIATGNLLLPYGATMAITESTTTSGALALNGSSNYLTLPSSSQWI